MRRSFTLIELLIVIGILSVLVVTILITLNPAEAQMKTRDLKRMKDINTLQAIIVQWIQDGNVPLCPIPAGCVSTNNSGKALCNDNWIGQNLCNYAKTVPVAPRNGQSIRYVYTGGVAPQTAIDRYYIYMSGSDYVVAALQESTSNIKNVRDDGKDDSWAEVGSNVDLMQ